MLELVSNGTVLNDTWLFDSHSLFWSQLLTPVAPSARFSSVSATHNDGDTYVFGGFSASITPLDDLWVFRSSSLTWELMSTLNQGPSARGFMTGYFMGDDFIIVSGCDSLTQVNYIFACVNSFNETWSFNINTKLWNNTNVSGTYPSSFSLETQIIDDSQLLVYANNKYTMAAFYVLSTADSSWSQIQFNSISPLPDGRNWASFVTFDTDYYMFGG